MQRGSPWQPLLTLRVCRAAQGIGRRRQGTSDHPCAPPTPRWRHLARHAGRRFLITLRSQLEVLAKELERTHPGAAASLREGHAPRRYPTPREPGGTASHPASRRRHARRSTSSSSAASPPTTRAQTPEPAAAAPPARTVPPPTREAHPTSPAIGQALRYGPRPPQDRLKSTQPGMITRWPPYVRD
jgi:hypothetical protein